MDKKFSIFKRLSVLNKYLNKNNNSGTITKHINFKNQFQPNFYKNLNNLDFFFRSSKIEKSASNKLSII